VITGLKIGPRNPRLWLASGALVLLCGCRRGDLLGAIPASGDAAPGDGASGMTLTPLHFAPPQLVPGLSVPFANDEDPTFTGDLLELYFMSTRNNMNQDLWTSRRLSAADPWGTPSMVAELSTMSAEFAPGISFDGLTIWFATDRDPTHGWIWRSTRAARTDPWSAPVPVGELARGQVDSSPAVDATETLLVLGVFQQGFTAGVDIYAATRPSASAPWGIPRPMPGVNGPADDVAPFVAQGGLVIFFASTRGGNSDLYYSSRRSTDEPFPAPVALTDLNSPSYESDPTLSPDLTYMMFTSSRAGSTAIYEAHAMR
jgi:hypothetical protein